MEEGCGGRVWRKGVEEGCGGRVWRRGVEEGCGGGVWRRGVEEKRGGRVWRRGVEEGCGGGVWRKGVEEGRGFSVCSLSAHADPGLCKSGGLKNIHPYLLLFFETIFFQNFHFKGLLNRKKNSISKGYERTITGGLATKAHLDLKYFFQTLTCSTLQAHSRNGPAVFASFDCVSAVV